MSSRSRSRSRSQSRAQEDVLVRVSALSGSLLLERRFAKDCDVAAVKEAIRHEAKEPLAQIKLIQEKGRQELAEDLHLCDLHLGSQGLLDLLVLRTSGHFALVGFADGSLRLWDLERGALAHQLLSAAPSVTGLEVDWQRRRALSGDMNNNVRHWDLEQGCCLHCMVGHAGIINGVHVDWERQKAATFDRAGLLIFWDLNQGLAFHTILAHEGMVLDVEVDWGDTVRSVSVGLDHHLVAWTGDQQLCRIALPGSDLRSGPSASLDELVDGGLEPCWESNQLLAIWDSAVYLWDLQRGRAIHRLQAPTGRIAGFDVHWDSSRCVAWSSAGQCLLWCLQTGQLLEKLSGPETEILGLSCSWEKGRLLGYAAGPLLLWSLAPAALLAKLPGHSDAVANVEVSWDDDRALSWSDDATLRLWDLKEHVCLLQLAGHTGPVWSAHVDWQSSRALSYSFAQKALCLWDLKTGDVQKFFFDASGQATAPSWNGGAEVNWESQRAVAWSLAGSALAVVELGTGAVQELQGSCPVHWLLWIGKAANDTKNVEPAHMACYKHQ